MGWVAWRRRPRVRPRYRIAGRRRRLLLARARVWYHVSVEEARLIILRLLFVKREKEGEKRPIRFLLLTLMRTITVAQIQLIT